MEELHPCSPWGDPPHFSQSLDGTVAEGEVEAEEDVSSDGGSCLLRREERSVSPDVRDPPLLGAGTSDLILYREVTGSAR